MAKPAIKGKRHWIRENLSPENRVPEYPDCIHSNGLVGDRVECGHPECKGIKQCYALHMSLGRKGQHGTNNYHCPLDQYWKNHK
jgi:hypothetical protein